MTKHCLECGEPATEDHHVIPQSLGGKVTVPLCGGCHALVHGGYNRRRDDHKELTIEGLRKAKERGVILGNRTNLKDAQAKGAAAQSAQADAFLESLRDVLESLEQKGLTMAEMAEYLTQNGFKTARGGKWSATHICRMLKRLKVLGEQKGVAQAA